MSSPIQKSNNQLPNKTSFESNLDPIDSRNRKDLNKAFDIDDLLDRRILSKDEYSKQSPIHTNKLAYKSNSAYRSLNMEEQYQDVKLHNDRSPFSKFVSHYYKTGDEIDMEKLAKYAKMSYNGLYNKENNSANANLDRSSYNKKTSKIGDILSEMKHSQAKLKKSYFSYKLDRFSYYLNKVAEKVEHRQKEKAFRLLIQEAVSYEAKIDKV